ncbi:MULTISPECIES: ogr/Delta-like zinc finger family protein [Halomonas]|uniref:ogr/Delta-like zinc finger family protein n=1 Tax=Halomonas sp. R57-5 TaxID=1610576 RepID=UPI0006818BCA
MKGIGEKCLACGSIMRTKERRRITYQHQEAVLQCFGCRRLWYVDLHFSPVRAYKRSKAESEISEKEPEASCILIDEKVCYPDELCFFGDMCGKCGSYFRVRTSRRVSEYFKAFYLSCTGPSCGAKMKVEMSITLIRGA